MVHPHLFCLGELASCFSAKLQANNMLEVCSEVSEVNHIVAFSITVEIILNHKQELFSRHVYQWACIILLLKHPSHQVGTSASLVILSASRIVALELINACLVGSMFESLHIQARLIVILVHAPTYTPKQSKKEILHTSRSASLIT